MIQTHGIMESYRKRGFSATHPPLQRAQTQIDIRMTREIQAPATQGAFGKEQDAKHMEKARS